jgi:hypothetical protein
MIIFRKGAELREQDGDLRSAVKRAPIERVRSASIPKSPLRASCKSGQIPIPRRGFVNRLQLWQLPLCHRHDILTDPPEGTF